MSPDEVEAETIYRLDENVKYIREKVDKLTETTGRVKEKANRNENDIKSNGNKISWNRKIMTGIFITVLAGIIIALFSGGIPV